MVLGLCLVWGSLLPAFAAGTPFSYQGRLRESGANVDGAFDFEFRLFGAATHGVQVGDPLQFEDVAVVDGLFSVLLDFGADAFPGADRWIETSVRPGAETGPYATLNPRRLLAAVPYAMRASKAASADSAAVATSLSGTEPPGFVPRESEHGRRPFRCFREEAAGLRRNHLAGLLVGDRWARTWQA